MKNKTAYMGFIKMLVVASLVLVAAGILTYTYLTDYYTPVFPFLMVFFITSSLIIFDVSAKAVERRPAKFVNMFMLITTLKLLIYMAVMITYALLNREDARPFIISFFVLYIVYTVIEVVALLKVNSKSTTKLR